MHDQGERQRGDGERPDVLGDALIRVVDFLRIPSWPRR